MVMNNKMLTKMIVNLDHGKVLKIQAEVEGAQFVDDKN
jgi:hypothetical protein